VLATHAHFPAVEDDVVAVHPGLHLERGDAAAAAPGAGLTSTMPSTMLDRPMPKPLSTNMLQVSAPSSV
jgi:hypothetical protein